MAATLLSQIPLFSDLSEAEIGELSALLKRMRVENQQPVFWFGDKGTDFFIVEEGRVHLSYPDEAGKDISLANLGPGNFFGELSLLDGGPRTATARAASDLSLLCLGRQDFLQFMRTRPTAAIHMVSVLGRRQREMLDRLRRINNANDMIQAAHDTASLWHRVADLVSTVAASQPFVVVHMIWFGFWVIFNLIRGDKGWDPFPFQLLTLIVSLEAIFLSIFVLVSANLQGEKDRIRADLDYQVNLKAHAEVMQLHQKIDRLESALAERKTT